MRLWHLATIAGILLIATLIFTQKKGYYRIADVVRKIIAMICALGGLFFGGLGLIYVRSDILAMFAIKAGKNYADGPGLGLMIGLAFIFFVAGPLIAVSVLFFRFKKKKV